MNIAVAVPYQNDLDRVLLLRRATDMDVFPGRWNFPSGQIEDEQPEHAAVRELQEETGLRGSIERNGDLLTLDETDHSFKLHPFFVMVDDIRVTLNEEHDQYRWVEKERINQFDTVPALRKDLERLDML